MDFVVRAPPYLEAPSVDKYQFEETECKKRVIKLTARGSDFGRACHLLSIRHSRVYRDARYVYRDGSVLFPKNERESESTVSIWNVASRKERARAIRSHRPPVSLVAGGEWTQLPQPKRGVFSGVTLFRFSLLIAYRD